MSATALHLRIGRVVPHSGEPLCIGNPKFFGETFYGLRRPTHADNVNSIKHISMRVKARDDFYLVAGT